MTSLRTNGEHKHGALLLADELVQLSLAASRVTGVNRYERFFDHRPVLTNGLL
ncbi:hypothetical protein H8B09_03515 [Paenibacillus sp. PR3]|uniref:Uncharacterized protein n=1 Tax=Paenibacillus terricola TaxID=2763503 RepID=A0ABR8MPF7_9BACL|nr:hypothetical protein [Paenibacillus terricola]MBD3917808.1 hypothetical protein [Paenibacillus terricola]